MIISVLSRLIKGVVLFWWALLLLMISFTPSYWFFKLIHQLSHPSVITLIVFIGIFRLLWKSLTHTHTCWWNCGEAARLLLLWLVSDNQMWKGQKDALFAFKSEHKSTKKTHPCVEADTEECKHFASRGIISKMELRWHRGDVTVPNYLIKSLFLFYFRTKNILVAS